MVNKIKCYGECKQLLPTDNFHVNRSHPRGYKMLCKECSKKYARKYYKENTEKCRDYVDKIKHSIATSEWSKNNRDKRNRNEHKRRAAKKLSSGTYSIEDWNILVKKYDGKCINPNCLNIFPYKITVDHIIPLSKGGSNTIENLQPLCLSCNISKGTKTIDYRELERSEKNSR